MEHELKSWPKFFWDVVCGFKSFEVRRRDRPFKIGDVILLCEWDPATQIYSGRRSYKTITYIQDGGQFGVEPDYCVLGLKPAPNPPISAPVVRP